MWTCEVTGSEFLTVTIRNFSPSHTNQEHFHDSVGFIPSFASAQKLAKYQLKLAQSCTSYDMRENSSVRWALDCGERCGFSLCSGIPAGEH